MVLSFIVVPVVLRVGEPHREALGPDWLVPGLEIALLGALIAVDLVEGSKVTQSADSLLASGALIWLGTRSSSASATGSWTPEGRSLATAGSGGSQTSRSPSS